MRCIHGCLRARGEWLSLRSPFPVITCSVVEIWFLTGSFSPSLSLSLSLSNFSLGVCLLISLSFSIPLPLHSKKRLIILQCQIQSESCWELELLCGVIPTGDQTSRENNTQGVSAVLKVHMCAGSFTGHVLHEWDYERWLRVWEFVATSVDICLRHYTQRRLGGKKKIKNTEFGHKETKQAFDW